MKEWMGSAVNITFAMTDAGKMLSLAEVVLIYSEPTYVRDDTGQMIRQRRTGEYRIAAKAKGLRELGDVLHEWADDMEEQEEALNEKIAQGIEARRGETPLGGSTAEQREPGPKGAP